MGINVHDLRPDDSPIWNPPDEIAAARVVVDTLLADDPKRDDVYAMIFGGES